jgi:hypothetical protein
MATGRIYHENAKAMWESDVHRRGAEGAEEEFENESSAYSVSLG